MWGRIQNVNAGPLEAYLQRLAACGSRRADVLRCISQHCPSIRTRRSGVVGPEPDWSIRYSIIQNDEFGKRGHFPSYYLLRELFQPDMIPVSERPRIKGFGRATYARHACLDLTMLSDEGVLRWTRFANKIGVTFDGEFGYKFPKRSVLDRDLALREMKRPLYAATRKRSAEAALRRSSQRKLGKSSPVRTGSRSSPIWIREPLVVRPSISCSKLRRSWRRGPSSEGLSWSEYKLRVPNPPVLCLAAVPNMRSTLSRPVVDAIHKIYSRVEDSDPLGPLNVEPVKVQPQKYRVRYNCRVSHVEYTRLLAQLQSIEERGFNPAESWQWFALNHQLETVRADNLIVPYVYDVG